MKRICAMVLVLAMLVSVMPASAMAGGETKEAAHTHKECRDENCTERHEEITYTAWDKTDSLPTQGNYYLTKDVKLSKNAAVTGNLHLCLNGHTVKLNGCRIYLTGKLSICDCSAATGEDGTYTAGSISGGKSTNGGAIQTTASAEMYLYDGMITGCAATNGGGVYLQGKSGSAPGAKFYMYGGKLSKNTASALGGAVCVAGAGAEFYMYGGTITENTGKSGGAVGGYTAVMNLSKGIIANNNGTEGGAIYAKLASNVTLTGMNISGNTGTLGSSIYLENTAQSTITDSIITGNKGSQAIHMNSAENKLTLAGATKIQDNHNADGKDSNLYLIKDYPGVDVSGLGAGAKVGITLADNRISAGQMYITGEMAEGVDPSAYVVSDIAGYGAKLENKRLVLVWAEIPHSHKVCCDESCTEQHEEIQYQAWNKAGSLPTAGSWYLTTDVTLSNQTVATGDLNLCLNGHTVTGPNGKRILAAAAGNRSDTITISDCTAKTEDGIYTAGRLTGAVNNTTTGGGAIFIGKGHTLYLYDGIITGNTAYTSGGGVQVAGTMYMYGGEISGNQAKQVSGAETDWKAGGGIFVAKDGELYVAGGTIDGNEAKQGAGIYCNAGILEISGGKISENKATGLAGGIFLADGSVVRLSQEPVIRDNTANNTASNLVLNDKQIMELGVMGAKAKVGISTGVFRTITNTTLDYSTNFFCDDTNQYITYKNKALYVDTNHNKHTTCLCHGTSSYCDHEILRFVPWDRTDSLPTSGNYYLTVDVTVNSQTTLDAANLNLCLHGHTITVTKGRVFYLKNNAQLSIMDCKGNTGKITGAKASAIMTENVKESKTVVNLYGGVLTGNTAVSAGGAIIVQGGGTFNMYGGKITGNKAVGTLKLDAQGNPVLDSKGNWQTENSIGGGGVAMYGDGTTFNMYDGLISNNESIHVECRTASGSTSNKAGRGGGVYSNGIVNLYGGKITGNKALLGGAVMLSGKKAVMQMKNSSLSGNEAKGGGAVVIESGASFTMNGGEISANKGGAAGGGGIYGTSGTSMTMTGGKIARNRASMGGGLYLVDASGSFLGGMIVTNSAETNGGGIYARRSTCTLDGVTVENNAAKENGGGIYSGGAKRIELCNAIIINNKSTNGAGVYATMDIVTSGGAKTTYYTVVKIGKGVVVSGNVAAKNGGGLLLIGEESVMTMTGGTVKGNSAKNAGGILIQTKAGFTLSGGQITGNKAGIDGGGVYISTDSDFHMEGGSITKNDAKNNGGGLLMLRSKGKFSGGTISNNTALNGAGATISGAKVDIKNITIKGNTATKNCGGMRLSASSYTKNGVQTSVQAVVNMYGGTIIQNAAPKANGGGVLVESKDSTFNLYGGTIKNNVCGVGGGGVFISARAVFTMTGGTISNNEAAQGGGVYVLKGTGTVTGGKIFENTAEKTGGAVMSYGDGAVVTLKNLDIHSNKATSGGAIIAQEFGTVNMEDCKVRDNTAEDVAGGVYLFKVSHSSMKRVHVYDNTAGGGGGGVAIAVGADVKMDDMLVEGNQAGGIGGGVYNRGLLEMTNSTIRDNSTAGNGGGIGTFKTSSIPLGGKAGLFVKNTTISGNTAGRGAGVYMHLGCVCELTDVTITDNTSREEGSAIFSGGRMALKNVTATGNTAKANGYAVYLDEANYDGHTYYTGRKSMTGNMIIKDNQGGEMYMAKGTALAVTGSGFGSDAYVMLTLDSGMVSQRVFGVYNYEGGDQVYVLTAGNRSVTDMEIDDEAQVDKPVENSNWMYIGIIILATVILGALVVTAVVKSKKKAAQNQEVGGDGR